MRPEVPSNPGAFEELSKAREVCLFEKALGCLWSQRGQGDMGREALSTGPLQSHTPLFVPLSSFYFMLFHCLIFFF